MDAIEQFKGAMRAHGLTPPEIIEPGRLYRFATNGKRHDDAGWCKLFADGGGGVFGDFRSGLSESWQAQREKPFTPTEREAFRQRCEAERRAREAEEVRRNAEAREKAAAIWQGATPAPDDHAYLLRKAVKAHGLRLYHGPLVVAGMPCDSSLIVPARDGSGAIHTLQFIHPEKPDGDNKRFLPGGCPRGCYFSIGTMEGAATLCLCEGNATGASIHEATGYAVVVAFNAGNLLPVAQSLRAQFPNSHLILCADDDAATDGNPGLTKATEAARAVNVRLAIPDFGENRPEGATDFNDLHQIQSLEAVAECIRRQVDAGTGVDGDSDSEAYAGVPAPRDSEAGIAQAFTRRHRKDWRYVAVSGKWLMWTGQQWLIEPTLRVLDLIRAICLETASSVGTPSIKTRLSSVRTVSGAEHLARMHRKHAATVEQWDADLWVANTMGGVVDLKTGDIRPSRREDYMTKILAAIPEGECPRWKAFLGEICGGDMDLVAYIQRAVGYSLTGITNEHVLFFLFGTGANGKSVFMAVITAILADYAATAPLDTFMEARTDKHPTDVAGLRGARLVACTETEQGWRWAESKIKALTGGDKVTARFMRQGFFTYTPQFKLWIAGNHKPYIRNVDEAMKRRVHLVPFTVTIPYERRDKRLAAKLLLERDGILAWAVEGCLEWQRIGLAPPKAVLDATEEYFQEEDAVGQFIDEECVPQVRAKTPVADIFNRWRQRAEARGEHPATSRWLVRQLAGRGFWARRGAGNANMIEGLRLRAESSAYGEPAPDVERF